MPAKSQAQQRFFGMLEHTPGMAKSKGIDMSKSQMHDFASTPEKGLPEHAGDTPKRYYGAPKPPSPPAPAKPPAARKFYR